MKTIESLKVVSTREEGDVKILLCTERVAIGSGRDKDFHVIQVYKGREQLFKKTKTYFRDAMDIFNSLKNGKYKNYIKARTEKGIRP